MLVQKGTPVADQLMVAGVIAGEICLGQPPQVGVIMRRVHRPHLNHTKARSECKTCISSLPQPHLGQDQDARHVPVMVMFQTWRLARSCKTIPCHGYVADLVACS